MEAIDFSHEKDVSSVQAEAKPGILKLLKCKCPRCRKGDMFQDGNPWHLKNTMKMNRECPVCGQPLDIEVGFYYGSGYVSYALAIALTTASFIAWWIVIGFSLNDHRLFYWLGFNAIFLVAMQPYLMRAARTGWLALFVWYDKNWKINPPNPLERTNTDQENNW